MKRLMRLLNHVKPAKGSIVAASESAAASPVIQKGPSMVEARVGKPAPDFF
jgi:hypothetical protein